MMHSNSWIRLLGYPRCIYMYAFLLSGKPDSLSMKAEVFLLSFLFGSELLIFPA